MNRIFIILLLYMLCLDVTQIKAQDVAFSQLYSNPLYLNPAFAGSVGAPRVALQYRNQWHGFGDAYTTYNIAFDIPVDRLQGGLGIFLMNDAQAGHNLNSLQLNLVYSVYVQVGKEWWLNGGVQAGINQNSIRPQNLVFPDNLDPEYGEHGISGELAYLTDPDYLYPDFATGLLLYNDKIFGGVAVHHLAEPRQSFFEGSDITGRLYRKYTAHIGARLPVYLYGHLRKKFDILPQLVFQKQADFEQFNYGLFATKFGFTVGTWFRHNTGWRYDAIIFTLGFMKNNWQVTYSYDWTISGIWGDTGGTSEISLSFLLKDPSAKSRFPFYNRYEEEFGTQ